MLSQRDAFDIDPQILVLLRIEIAREHVGPGDGDRSDLVDISHSQEASGVIEDDGAHLLVWQAQADRPGAAFALRRIEAGDASALGQTIALDNLEAGLRFERLDQLGRHRRRAADCVFKAGDVVVADRRLEQGGIDRWHT